MDKNNFTKSYTAPFAVLISMGTCDGLLQASPQVEGNETYSNPEDINSYFE